MSADIVIAGVGGQGIVLASKLLARAAMRAGLFVRTSETIGMAQRGGSVTSHVRIGEVVHAPMVALGTADALIGFEPGEAVRCLPYLAPGGTIVVDSDPVPPVTAALARGSYDGREMLDFLATCDARVIVVDGRAACEAAGSPKVLNTALLGAAAAAGALGFSVGDLEAVVTESLPERHVAMNVEALRAGARSTTGSMR